jgi:hypothetical protein
VIQIFYFAMSSMTVISSGSSFFVLPRHFCGTRAVATSFASACPEADFIHDPESASKLIPLLVWPFPSTCAKYIITP